MAKKRSGGKKKGGQKRKGSRSKGSEVSKKVTWDRKTTTLVAVIIIAVGLFLLLCVFFTGSSGFIGRGVSDLLGKLVGIGRYLLPFMLIGTGIAFIVWREAKIVPSLIGGAIVIFITIISMAHVPINTSSMFAVDELSSGGGYIGASLAWLLVKAFGVIGAYIFLSAALLAGVILAFEEQISITWQRLRESRAKKKGALKEIAEEPAKKTKGRKKPKEKPVTYPSPPQPQKVQNERGRGGQLAIKITPQEKGPYKRPPTSILNRTTEKNRFSQKSIDEKAKAIEKTLLSFDVDAKVARIDRGPTVTVFEIEVGTGEKVKRVMSLSQDIAYALGSPDIRIYAPIPGKRAIGIEVPNTIRDFVLLGDVIDDLEPVSAHNVLTVAVGKDISGRAVIVDLAQLPHILLAGATGAGKSCSINAMLCSLLFRCRPDQLRLLLIDPKFVELTYYNGIPHLLTEVITDAEKASWALGWAVEEMEERYNKLQHMGVKDIDEYNALVEKEEGKDSLPRIVIVIDELADLMIVAPKEVESYIARLTAKARAVGIHLIVATQRPSVDVVTGLIKANIPARIAFQVASLADSRVVLDGKGAEQLVGKGDMLVSPGNTPRPIRVQGALVSQKEIEALTAYIKGQGKVKTEKIEIQEMAPKVGVEISDEDELLELALESVVFSGQASASMLQTKLRVGYARARRLIELLEMRGVVGPPRGTKAREVLMTIEEYEEYVKRRGNG